MLKFLVLPALGLLAACAPSPQPGPTGFASTVARRPAVRTDMVILAAHNAERARWRVAPLAWDPALEAGARSYADRLARSGRLVHSAKAERPGAGENLWMGTRGAFPVGAMVGGWLQEQRHFRPGVFPHVSTTGNWADVGHYTAMIWPTTTRVGCAIGAAGSVEVLVCRYAPSGNIDGRRVP